jgi:hypothetical protein
MALATLLMVVTTVVVLLTERLQPSRRDAR